MKIRIVLSLLLAACLPVALHAQAGTEVVGRETLRGLKGFEVLIEKLDPEANENGLSEKQLQTAVELKLRLAGIKVTTPEKAARTELPAVLVELTMMKVGANGLIPDGLIAYVLRVAVLQNVVVLGNFVVTNAREEHWAGESAKLCFPVKDWAQALSKAALPVRTYEIAGTLVVVGAMKLADSVNQLLAAQMDELLNDYLSVNPK